MRGRRTGRGGGRGGKRHVPPVGEIRQSQLVSTFGPGAMVDLIDHAVLVGGLDFWNFDARRPVTPLDEPRLREALASAFRDAERPLDEHGTFRLPPVGDADQPTAASGVQVLEFPQWFVCQNPSCRALVRASPDLEMKKGRYHHRCDRNRSEVCVPVRFVTACRRGHLDEFPWIRFVHDGGASCDAPSLRLREGVSGDFSEIVAECMSCGRERRLADATAPDFPLRCYGRRPWLGAEADEDNCTERARLLVRTASNGYFSQVVSALSIPDPAHRLEDAVQSVWDVLVSATAETLTAFRSIPKVESAIRHAADEDILAMVDAIRAGRTSALPREPLRTAEMRSFLEQPVERPGEVPPRAEDFFARRLESLSGLAGLGIERVVLAHKLREVRTQIGFTRLEPVSANLQGEFDLGVESAELSVAQGWLPSAEVRGEGVLLVLDEAAVRAWEERPAVLARGVELEAGYRAWTRRRESRARATGAAGSRVPPFPGVRFYLLHTLSHLLMSSLSLTCGYAASALRERIYCAPRDAALPMAAILISTGSAGAEGTLGGLVEEGRRLEQHLYNALEPARLCSSDPVCAHHTPEGDYAERFLEGAACHGCLFVAECSCERFNQYLDRALVVPILGQDAEAAFFGELGG